MNHSLFFVLLLVMIGGAYTSFGQVEDYLRSGKAQLQKENYEEAIQDFNEVIRLKNNDEEAYYHRGKAYKALKQYDKATQDFSSVLTIQPKSAKSHAQLAHIAQLKKEYNEALNHYNQAIALQPDERTFYVSRSYLYQITEQYAKALEDCQKALRLYPSDHQALYRKASLQFLLQNRELALETIEQALLLQNKVPDYQVLKGRILQQKGLYSQAVDNYMQAINLDSQHAPAYYHKGQTAALQGDILVALKDLDKAIQLNPHASNYYDERASLYKQINDYEQALKEYDQLLQVSPNQAYLFTEKAQIYLRLNQYEKALALCEEALAINPYFQEPFVIRGVAKLQTGRVQDGNEDFYTYLRTAVSGRDYYFIARQIHDHITDRNFLEKAEQWAFKAIQKEDIYVHNHLYASILYKLGKNLSSLEVANKAISLAKKEAHSYEATQKILLAVSQSTVDDIPPVITLASPAVVRGGVVVGNENEVHVIGKASDESGVKEVLVNGNPAKLLANGDFEGNLLIKDKMQDFTIEATDTKGNMPQATFKLLRETKVTAAKQKKYTSLGKCYALIFATDTYEYWNDLVNPIKDAQTIAKDLENIYGFQTDLVLNPTQQQIILKLKEYLKKQYRPNDQLFILFAGHGQFDETFKEGYVVAKDSQLDDATKVSYLPHSVLRTYVDNIACKHILLMMDVCFGGTFDPLLAIQGVRGNEEKKEDVPTEEFIRRKLAAKTRKYITSGGKEYVPDGTPGNHSPFARRFLDSLRRTEGKYSILEKSETISHKEMISPEHHAVEKGRNEP
ncbi:MAG: tetratricopeptide repeat protein, partial [Thermonemataceae bacterium]